LIVQKDIQPKRSPIRWALDLQAYPKGVVRSWLAQNGFKELATKVKHDGLSHQDIFMVKSALARSPYKDMDLRPRSL